MDHLFLQFPQEFGVAVEKIRNQDWLLSYFPASKEELYNPAGYVYNTEFYGYEYKIILDRNIFRFITSALKKENPNEKQRAAIALVHFCQASNIVFEPNLAVYERLLPKRENTEAAINELITFYKIDNADSDSLLDFSIGKSNKIEVDTSNRWNKRELHESMVKYQWLTEWKSLYLILLKIVLFDNQNICNREKVGEFMTWLVKEFRLSLPCTVFAIFLFSSKRKKNMNKIKKKYSNNRKLDQMCNMTWDLFLINEFFRTLTDEKRDSEYLIATDDHIIKFILRAALGVQHAEDFQFLKTLLPINEHDHVDLAIDIMDNTKDRVYDTNQWSLEYRDTLIESAEIELFEMQ